MQNLLQIGLRLLKCTHFWIFRGNWVIVVHSAAQRPNLEPNCRDRQIIMQESRKTGANVQEMPKRKQMDGNTQ